MEWYKTGKIDMPEISNLMGLYHKKRES